MKSVIKYLHTPNMGANGHSFVLVFEEFERKSEGGPRYQEVRLGLLHLPHVGRFDLKWMGISNSYTPYLESKTFQEKAELLFQVLEIKCKDMISFEKDFLECKDTSSLLLIRLAGFLEYENFECSLLPRISNSAIRDPIADIMDFKSIILQ